MLTSRRTLSIFLVATATTGATVAPAHAATKAKPASAKAILSDCKKDDEISKKYRLADLKAAQKAYKKKPKGYGDCGVALTSAISGLSGKKGTNTTKAVVKECRTGALKKKYKAATLKKALANLPNDVADYTSCASAIRSQYNTVR